MLDNAVQTAAPSRKFTPDVSRALRGLGLGNAMEWYDWMIFGLLSAFIGPNFFPSDNALSATLGALAVFAIGFAFRPLGGILLGTLADRIGRRRIMLLSVGLMSVTTLIIAIAPTYQQIGVWAGVILLACRIFQGISAGVEAPLSTSHALELAPEGREGMVAGLMSFYVNFGILIASLTAFACTSILGAEVMADWGWRVPFALGALFGLVVLIIRRTLPETMAPEELAENTTRRIWGAIRKHWMAILAIVFIVGAVQAYNYAWTVGLPNSARATFGENPTAVFAVSSALAFVMLIGSWVVGRLADGRSMSKWFIVSRLLAIPSVFLMLLYVAPGMGGFTAVMLGGSVVLVLNMTLYNVVSSTLLPKACRGTGVAVGYGVGVAVFGGTASYLLVWLQSVGATWVFPVYVAVLCALSLVFYLLARARTGLFIGN
ncbi:MFS transporter [Mycetocola spongiae]|uniref:MFS transporter n=1 Tax=Mycetocola spongiae TaxID=2859226 RepID=UPI001CF4C6A0|nr:MFS transporter [Mycetocola spongiae]